MTDSLSSRLGGSAYLALKAEFQAYKERTEKQINELNEELNNAGGSASSRYQGSILTTKLDEENKRLRERIVVRQHNYSVVSIELLHMLNFCWIIDYFA
jgi:hypothetical protein